MRKRHRCLATRALRFYLGGQEIKEGAMAILASDIEAMIRESFPDARITVQGDDGAHFAAEVVDESFRGKNRVQQQRAVYAALKGKMDGANGELHALALTTKAPD